MELENKILWMWIKNIFKGSNSTVLRLSEIFGSIKGIYEAQKNDYKNAGLKAEIVRKLSDKSLDGAYKILKRCESMGINVICIDDDNYPYMLKNIYDPPPVIYIRGNIDAIKNRLTIAGVGTRNANSYGINTAKKIAFDLAGAGAVVVSGMASGIDSAAHTGAIAADGITVAVLGTAIDRIYPAENAYLYKKITEIGAVVSEHPPGSVTYPSDFLRRNRIIAGLSHGVFVCQAPCKSGSLTTAKLALDAGRDVFCVAGNSEPINEGSNGLLTEGAAKLILSADDILEEYEHYNDEFGINKLPEAEKAPKKPAEVKKKGKKFNGLSPMQENIVEFLEGKCAAADEICEGLGLSFSVIAAELTELEILDILNNDNGNYSINY